MYRNDRTDKFGKVAERFSKVVNAGIGYMMTDMVSDADDDADELKMYENALATTMLKDGKWMLMNALQELHDMTEKINGLEEQNDRLIKMIESENDKINVLTDMVRKIQADMAKRERESQ